MTAFFTIPGRVRERAGCWVIGHPPSSTNDYSGTVRSNTVDWKRRDRVATDEAAGLEAAFDQLKSVAKTSNFGELVEGREVHARLSALVGSWRKTLQKRIGDLTSLAQACRSGRTNLADANSSTADSLRA